ncbi:hypothetical protein GF319_10460 [Candidatus Bathyarchaeota archaeon]|nr:hypothetical protein [Candidatus Bathyarchaeota archaeon]
MKPKDRDFIETKEGLIFCVVGYLHPSDRITSYLKYIPSIDGIWQKGEVTYKRMIKYYHVSQIESTYSYLEKKYPEYIFLDPIRDIKISAVPKNSIKRYYIPKIRLLEILENPLDVLEEKASKIVKEIQKKVNIENNIGITGSVLTSLHNPNFSDLDFTVNGWENVMKVKKAILDLKSEGFIRFLSENELSTWCKERSEKFPLSVSELRRIAKRRWNFGYFEDIYFSLHATRDDDEIKEVYGNNLYTKLGEVSGKGVISDVKESLYNPAIYKIRNSSTEKEVKISEIVSFESLYSGLFNVDDLVQFKGVLEKVEGKNNYHRVVLGAAGTKNSYVKWFIPQD